MLDYSTLCYLARLLFSPLEESLLHWLDTNEHESRIHRNKARRAAKGTSPFWSAQPARYFPPQPAIVTKAFFWALPLSRLCVRCYFDLLALRLRPKSKRKTTSHSLVL